MKVTFTVIFIVIFTGKHPWWSFVFTEIPGLEFIPAISLKRTPS